MKKPLEKFLNQLIYCQGQKHCDALSHTETLFKWFDAKQIQNPFLYNLVLSPLSIWPQ